jgi:hypothetical protein
MATSCTHIAFTTAAADPAGAWMRSLANSVATGGKTTRPYSLIGTRLR